MIKPLCPEAAGLVRGPLALLGGARYPPNPCSSEGLPKAIQAVLSVNNVDHLRRQVAVAGIFCSGPQRHHFSLAAVNHHQQMSAHIASAVFTSPL